MDEFLNELYGTSEIIQGEDLEKQAAAEFLVKLAEQEGVNLDDLSDEEVGGLLAEIEGEMGKEAEAESDPSEEDVVEAQEKLAEADFLGRAMAHAYVNELHEIEKQAASGGSKRPASNVTAGVGVQPSASEAAKYEAEFKKQQAGKASASRQAASERKYGGESRAGSGASRGRQVGKTEAALRQAGQSFKQYHKKGAGHLRQAFRKGTGATLKQRAGHLARGAGRFAPHAAAAGLLGYGAYKALKGSEKKSYNEEFEALAEQRAYEMLEEAGYPVEKVAEADIEVRALQMLEENGYPVNWE